VLLHQLLVELGRVAGLDGQRALGAIPKTGPQTVTQCVLHQLGLAVDDLDRTLGTRRDAVPTAVAEVLVDLDDLSLHDLAPSRCIPFISVL